MSGGRAPQKPPNQDEINDLLNLKAKLAHQAEETDRLLHQLQDLKLNSQHKTSSSNDGGTTTESPGQSPARRRQQQQSASSTAQHDTSRNHSIKFPKPLSSTNDKILQLQQQLKHLPFVKNIKKSWVVSEEEQSRYNVIFSDIDEEKSGIVTIQHARPIFLQSQLPSATLKKIWTLCDIDQSGRLMRDEFALAMWLIERAVRNVPVPDQLTTDMLPPIHIRSSTANNPQVELHTWVVNVADEQRYNVTFFDMDKDVTGFVSGADAKLMFLQSGLPPNVLFHIWSLCDTTQCGKLTREQFALAMWLIEQKIKGVELPSQLTPEMVPPSMKTKKSGGSQTSGVEPSAPCYDSLPPQHMLGRPPKDEEREPTNRTPFRDNFVATPPNQEHSATNGTYTKSIGATHLLGVVELKRPLEGLSPLKRAVLAELCRNSLQESGNTTMPNIAETTSNESWIGRVRFCNLTVTVTINLEDLKLNLYVGNEKVNQHSILNISTLVILKDDCRQLVYMVNFGTPHYCKQMAVVLAFNDHKHALKLSNIFRDIKKAAHGDTSIVKINLPKERNQGICNDVSTKDIQDSLIYENDLKSKISEISQNEMYENEIQVPTSYENDSRYLESEASSVYEDEVYEDESQDGNTYENELNKSTINMHPEKFEEIYENELPNSLPCINPTTQDKSNDIPDLSDSDSMYEYEDSQPHQQQQKPSQIEHVRTTPNIPDKNKNTPPSLPPRNPMKNTIDNKISAGKTQKKVQNDKQKMNLKDLRKLLSGFKKSSKYEYQKHDAEISQDSGLVSYQSWPVLQSQASVNVLQSQASVNNVTVHQPVQLQTPPLFTQKNDHDFPQMNDDDFSDFSSDDGINH